MALNTSASVFSTILTRAGQAFLGITRPYYRFYRQNTIVPVQSIATSIENGEIPDVVAEKLKRWRDKKLYQFQFVQVAGTLLAVAVIGCFSWPENPSQHWVGPAAWYCSMVFSITAVLLASTEAVIFSAINNSPLAPAPSGTSGAISTRIVPPRRLLDELPMVLHVEGWDTGEGQVEDVEIPLVKAEIKWNMVFTWHAPIILMAYSVVGYFVGLVVFVSTPLYDGHEGVYLNGPTKGAILFVVSSSVSVAVFIWCSFWAYSFVELDDS